MKPAFSILIAVALLLQINACKKSSATDNRPPADSTSQIPADTSSLKKTTTYYSLSAGNPNPTDSQFYSYEYDEKRRLTRLAHYSPTIQSGDTTVYKYFSGYYTSTSAIYFSGIQAKHSENTFYGTEGATPDSILTKNTVTDNTNGSNSTSRTVYLKDANGNDTLELHSYFPEGAASSSWFVKHWYTNSVEDSNYQSDPVVSFSYIHSGGNLVTLKYYTDGVLRQTGNFTYSTIPSRGFYEGVNAAAPLIATYQDIEGPGSSNSNHLETYIYSFDLAGRVLTQRLTYDISPYEDFRIYTYY